MRKLISLMLALVLALGLVCAQAEETNFLVSDWMLLYTLGDNAIDESTLFIYEDNTFELMTEEGNKKGTWTFDGETLTLTGGDETLSLKWIEAEHRFKGDFGGMGVTMYMAIEPEEEQQAGETAEVPASLPAGDRSAAAGQTVYTKVTVDRETAKNILSGFGISEEQRTVTDQVLSLVNALGVKVTIPGDGAQIDLDLNGENALTLGFASDEQGLRLAGSLFPNFILSMKQETLNSLLEQFTANMPALSGIGSEENAEGTMRIMPTSMPMYISSFIQACTAAAVPGEPVKGEYQFDGYNFDTMVPVTVYVPALKEAFKSMTDEMLKDESVMAQIRQSVQMSGAKFDPEEMRKAFAEFEAHFPDTVTAEFYQNSDGGPSFYVTGQASYEGKEGPSFAYTMLMKDEKSGTMAFYGYEQEMIIGLTFGSDGFRIEYKTGETQTVFDLAIERGEPTTAVARLYFTDTDNPLITVTVSISSEGVRTLPLETGEKTVLALEEIMNGESEAKTGLMTDLMMNGLSPLLMKLSKAVPEAAGLITSLMMPQTDQQKIKEPAEETEPQAQADPSSWKTLGDVLSLETGSKESSWDDETYAYIFEYAGTQWLVKAAFSGELNDAVNAVDFMAEDRDEQIKAILDSCDILSVTDLSTLALPQAELNQWIGKTGQDLLDAGWEFNGYYSDETGLHVMMVNGDFQYQVAFEEELTMSQVFGEQPENMPSATISGIAFDGKSYSFNELNY